MPNFKPICRPRYCLQPSDKLYFLHIYKTAGTSLSYLLEQRFQRDEVCPAHQLDTLAKMSAEEASRYRLYWGHLGLKLADFVSDPLIYITMLRNPVDHVISMYEAIRRSPEHPHHERARDMTLARFLRDERMSLEVRDVQVFTIAFWHEIWNAGRTARLGDGSLSDADREEMRREVADRFFNTPEELLVRKAIEVIERCAFVGLVERMEESMSLLATTFGWEPFGVAPRLNAAPSRGAEESLTTEKRNLISRVSRKAIETIQSMLTATFGWEPFALAPGLKTAPSRGAGDRLTVEELDLIGRLTRMDTRLHAHALGLFERHLLDVAGDHPSTGEQTRLHAA